MKKSRGISLFFALVFAAGLHGQSLIDLSPLNADITTLFTSLGQGLSPRLHQLATSGNDLVGEAELHGPLGVEVSLAGLSVATMDGIAKALGTTSSDVWKFPLISIPQVVSGAVSSADPTIATGLTMATTSAFAWPALRLGIGFRLPAGFEVLGNGLYASSSLLDSIGVSLPAPLSSLGTNLDMISGGIVVRKVILAERKGSLRPSISIGASYDYSSFDMGLSNFSLDALGVQPIDIQGIGTLGMSGKAGFQSRVQTFGALFHVSKTVLWVLTPYVKAGAYYHMTDYSSTLEATASVVSTTPGVPGISQAINAPVALHEEDASLILSGGLELKLLVMVLTIGTSLDLERPIVQLPSFANMTPAALMAGTKLNGLGLTVAMRMQI